MYSTTTVLNKTDPQLEVGQGLERLDILLARSSFARGAPFGMDSSRVDHLAEMSRLGEQIETAYALNQLVTASVHVFFYPLIVLEIPTNILSST